jgi:hypothetical protein
MIEQILNLLRVDDFYGNTNAIEIAKGKYKLPETVKEVFKLTRREIKYKKAHGKAHD